MTETIFQVWPSVVKELEGQLSIDVDCLNSLRVYLEHVDKVILACVVSKDSPDSGLRKCQPLNELPSWAINLEIIPLPNAQNLKQFVQHYNSVCHLLRGKIQEAQYLWFAPHWLIGDWAGIACLEAIKLNRPYVIDADVVYHEVARLNSRTKPFWKRYIKESIYIPIFKRYYQYLLGHASMVLLRGKDVYDEFSPFCRESHKIYHPTVTVNEQLSPFQLNHKIDALLEEHPLRICYVGRAIEMKGALDWIYALNGAIQRGVNLQATWLGEGSLLPQMKDLTKQLGLEKCLTFLGFVAERETLVKTLRESDIFLFCHKTRESPRCLIEALALGCPLIGYDSEYARDLVAQYGGGMFVRVGDWQKLSEMIVMLNSNRNKLGALIQAASASGMLYERDAAYAHRVSLIKQHYSQKD